MNKETLTLEHRELLYHRLKVIDTAISEYSFPNLYLFRKGHSYEVLKDREVFVTGVTFDGKNHLMPTVDPRTLDRDYLESIIREQGMLFPVPEAWLDGFDESRYLATYEDGDTDYIHYTEKMGNYPGKKLHSKRNLLKQFKQMYEHRALPLTEKELPDAMEILEDWQDDIPVSKDETDYQACREGIDLYDELTLCGAIYYADGEPCGFIIGEELNEKVFALHFAKGKKKFKGVYQYIFNDFAKVVPSKYCCLNFEQDLGLDSLRQAKASYKPEWMEKKYRISLKEE